MPRRVWAATRIPLLNNSLKCMHLSWMPSELSTFNYNMRMLGMSNVHTISGDSTRKLPHIGTHFGVIFLDPPWGGPEYKNATSIRLSLSGKRLSDVCWQLSVHTDFIALKVPKNFDENEFLTDTAPFMSLIHKNTQLRKMHLLIFKVNPLRESGESRSREERLAT